MHKGEIYMHFSEILRDCNVFWAGSHYHPWNKLISLEQKPVPFMYRSIMCMVTCVWANTGCPLFFSQIRKINDFYLTSCNSYYRLQTASSTWWFRQIKQKIKLTYMSYGISIGSENRKKPNLARWCFPIIWVFFQRNRGRKNVVDKYFFMILLFLRVFVFTSRKIGIKSTESFLWQPLCPPVWWACCMKRRVAGCLEGSNLWRDESAVIALYMVSRSPTTHIPLASCTGFSWP